MAQLSDDCFSVKGGLMPLYEALDQIKRRVTCVVEAQPLPLHECYGRIAAGDIVAAAAVPPHDNSAVDGYAFRFDDLSGEEETAFRLCGRTAAGHPFEDDIGPRQCVRIFTGAKMPSQADTVLMQEDARLDGDKVYIPRGLKPGANRRRAGEDIRSGDVIIRRGHRLDAADIGLAASVGCRTIDVYRPLRVALFSTGDELREPGEELSPGMIHDSNRYVLRGLLLRLGCDVADLGILGDDRARVRKALEEASVQHDLIITSGGVSVGEEDHVKAAVEQLGRIYFWRLAIKPGRPIALGQIGSIPFAGLPGNPVAVALTFLRVVRPMIERLSGAAWNVPRQAPVRLGFDLKKKSGRREWIRVALNDGNGDAIPVARKFEAQGAGILSSVAQSDGILEIDEDVTELAKDSVVPFFSFKELGL